VNFEEVTPVFFTWKRWLSKATTQTRKPQRAATVRRAATGRERYIPYIEHLETRLAPNIDFVTNLSGNASTPGSLGYEVANAAAGDTIQFQTTGTIYLTSGNVSITQNLTIDGTGANITVSGANLSGNSYGGVFNDKSSATVRISGLNITGGSAQNGGGIANFNGTLTLTNDILSGNSATSIGGGIYNFSGAVTLNNVTLSNNSATNAGGGIFSEAGALTLTNDTLSGNSATHSGGGIFNDAALTLTNDTLSGNSASIKGGGIYNNGGTLTLTSDTLSGNSASTGGGIYNNDAALTLTNDTLSGNSASIKGGGIYNDIGGTLTLTSDTLSGNSATNTGGGIYNIGGSSVTVYDTIIAGNTASTSPDFSGAVTTDKGYNLIGNTSGSSGFSKTNHDILSPGNLYLGFLQNNGGPTPTIALLPGSPALGAGDPFTLTGASATASIKAGAVTAGNITSGGFDYVTPPTVTITGDGTGAMATATISNGQVTGITIFNGGMNYTTATISFSGGFLTTDQRGFQRVVNGKIDIGAYENQSQLFTLAPPASEPTVVVGYSGSFNLGSFAYPGAANVWQVDVSWGDGTPDTVFSTFIRGSLGTQSHTYATAGSYAITITLTDVDGNFGQMSSPNVMVLPSLVVTNTSDSGPGSLRQAISDANLYYANGTITFAANVTGTITVASSALPQMTRGLSIQGPGANVLAVSGGNLYRVYSIGSHGNVQISGLTISHGGNVLSGGGVYVKTGGNLTLSNDVITNNSAVLGGGIYTSGITTLTNVIIQNNVAASTGLITSGGGVYVQTGGNLTLSNGVIRNNTANYGGGIHNNGITTLTNVAIQNNVATSDGGGISAATFGNLTLTNDTLSGNQALQGSGGGIVSASGANTLTLTNVTIANNSATVAGGGLSLGYTVHLNNDTIAGNSAASGGGIDLAVNATMTIFDTIVDGNSATIGNDIDSNATSATSSGGNLYGITTGNAIPWLPGLDHQDLNDNPGLAALGDNGGPTQTMAELPGSLALGKGYILPSPALQPFTTATTGGTLLDGSTYYYVVTALNSQGQTLPSAEGSILTGSGTNTNTVTVNWTAVPGATGYKIYGRAKGAELLLATVGNVTTYTDTGSVTPSGPLPTSNTTVPLTDQRGFSRVIGGTIDSGAFENQSQWFQLFAPASEPSPDALQSTSFNLGSFTYSGSAANVWLVDVSWGDGTSDTIFSTTRQGSLGTQKHTYANSGPYTITVAITDADCNFAQLSAAVTVYPVSWQIPPLPEKFLFTYRRHYGFGGFTQANPAISIGTGFDAGQVVGQSLFNPTLTADVNVNGAQAAGVAAHIQGNDNAYVAVLTSTGQAMIGLFNAASNSITPLATTLPGGPTTGTLTFTITGGATPTLSLYLNGSLTPLLTVTPTGLNIIAGAGGVGIFAEGANGSVGNFSLSGSEA
jgi:hypothetical protein